MRALVTVNKSGTAQRVRGSEREGHKEGARSYVRSLSATSTPRHCLHELLSNIALPVICTQFPSSVYCFCCCCFSYFNNLLIRFSAFLSRCSVPFSLARFAKRSHSALTFSVPVRRPFLFSLKYFPISFCFSLHWFVTVNGCFRLNLYCNIICFLDHIFLYILNTL